MSWNLKDQDLLCQLGGLSAQSTVLVMLYVLLGFSPCIGPLVTHAFNPFPACATCGSLNREIERVPLRPQVKWRAQLIVRVINEGLHFFRLVFSHDSPNSALACLLVYDVHATVNGAALTI